MTATTFGVDFVVDDATVEVARIVEGWRIGARAALNKGCARAVVRDRFWLAIPFPLSWVRGEADEGGDLFPLRRRVPASRR